jgi:tetratricopeptide (TPR) repeat protein
LAALARADLLNLEERRSEDETVHAVLGWLKANPGWLLILDNVDSPEAESEVLALLPGLAGGRVLITSRLRSWPHWVNTQPLDTIPLEEARDFLLKRTDGRRRAAPDDADRARDLAEKLDGLPLALEQAGAYIVHTRLSLTKYLEVWEEERQRVLEWHDKAVMGYPASVAITWKASFDRLRPTAATLLRLCAFLAPDPIPEEMFESRKEYVEGACELLRSETGHVNGVGSIHEALAELESYSLISRQEGTFTVHRVVQEVLQSRVSPERLRDWIEATLKIVNGYAPFDADDVRTWPVWNVLRSHAARVILLADEVGLTNPTSRLMNQLGQYLDERGLYTEAEPLMRRALDIEEVSFGSQHPNVAIYLNNLAALLKATDRLSEAEPLMRRALDIDEASFGSQHPDMARDLNNLAQLLQATDRLSEAEPLMRRALDIDEASFGSDHPEVATDLNNLAGLLQATNRLSEAEPLVRRALDIDEASFDSDHPNVARDLNNLAQLLKAANCLSEAEPLMRQAVAILERSLGPDHPKTRITQRNLAALLAEIASQNAPPPPAPGGGDSVIGVGRAG